jgi:pyruvate ferredoxin oxidoreductase beta subunit/2-oxoisovalerate ferredoxin oxidoreductase beta subunit
MNTGAQKSSATPRSARTGSTPAGKTSRKKNLVEIMAAHGVPYVATASVSHLDDLLRKVRRARETRGLRLLHLLIPCLDGWGLAEDAGLITARAAVDCGAWPLVEVEDGEHWTLNSRRSRPLADYLALQKRYRGLSPEQVAALQDDVDRGWQRLQRLQQLG